MIIKIFIIEDDRATAKALEEELESWDYQVTSAKNFNNIVVGLIFLVGTVLITYYKQISAAYEDRHNYHIMEKVGLPDKLIKNTSRNQILWMFFLPLGVAGLHSAIASKIIFQILALFGIHELREYLICFASVIAVFALVYLCVFLVTSRMYYRIVK